MKTITTRNSVERRIMNENASTYLTLSIVFGVSTLVVLGTCAGGCDLEYLNVFLVGVAVLISSALLMFVWYIHELYYPSPPLSIGNIVGDFINEIPKLALLSISGYLLWFITGHAKHAANSSLGREVFGGRRRR
jgi:hypothetical protein